MARSTAKSVRWSSRRQAEGRRLRQLMLAAVPLTFAFFLLLVSVVLPRFQQPTPSSELNYAETLGKFKVYIYPDENPITDEFYASANVMNTTYDSQGYFLVNLMNSSYLTHDPDEAHFFFIPVKPQVSHWEDFLGGKNLELDAKYPSVDYVEGLRAKYPYWNRTLGADHFFLSGQDIGLRDTKEIHPLLLKNSIQVLYFSEDHSGNISNYNHKDVVLPGYSPPLHPQASNDLAERTTLGYCIFRGSTSKHGRFRSPRCIITEEDAVLTSIDDYPPFGASLFEEEYQKSKFCIFRLYAYSWTYRLPYIISTGCVPVIVSDNPYLPFSDVLDWRKFSVIVKGRNVYRLTENQLMHHVRGILKNITPVEYEELYKNLLKVQKHFQWNIPAVRHDAFHMVMYALWLRHKSQHG